MSDVSLYSVNNVFILQQDLTSVTMDVSRLYMQETRLLVKRVHTYGAIRTVRPNSAL